MWPYVYFTRIPFINSISCKKVILSLWSTIVGHFVMGDMLVVIYQHGHVTLIDGVTFSLSTCCFHFSIGYLKGLIF